MSKLSDWQTGLPPCDGVWEVLVTDYDGSQSAYFCRFKDGLRAAGYGTWQVAQRATFTPYIQKQFVWRGLIDD